MNSLEKFGVALAGSTLAITAGVVAPEHMPSPQTHASSLENGPLKLTKEQQGSLDKIGKVSVLSAIDGFRHWRTQPGEANVEDMFCECSNDTFADITPVTGDHSWNLEITPSSQGHDLRYQKGYYGEYYTVVLENQSQKVPDILKFGALKRFVNNKDTHVKRVVRDLTLENYEGSNLYGSVVVDNGYLLTREAYRGQGYPGTPVSKSEAYSLAYEEAQTIQSSLQLPLNEKQIDNDL